MATTMAAEPAEGAALAARLVAEWERMTLAWVPTTRAEFDRRFEAVPPREGGRRCFLAGERVGHQHGAGWVYPAYRLTPDGAEARLMTRLEFLLLPQGRREGTPCAG